jgi:hypothetical protein
MTIEPAPTRRGLLGAGLIGIASAGGMALASGCAHASPQSDRNVALIRGYYAAWRLVRRLLSAERNEYGDHSDDRSDHGDLEIADDQSCAV